MNTEIICALIAGGGFGAGGTGGAAAGRAPSDRGTGPAPGEESRLAMELMYANCALSLTTAKKLAGMHTNGDVEEAMEAARSAGGLCGFCQR